MTSTSPPVQESCNLMPNTYPLPETPAINSIYHPSDFSEASKVAFGHALKIALIVGAKFYVHHVFEPNEEPVWEDYPGVRHLLTQWGLIDERSGRQSVADLKIKVRKVY